MVREGNLLSLVLRKASFTSLEMGIACDTGDDGGFPWPAASLLLGSCSGCTFQSLSPKSGVRFSSIIKNHRLFPTEIPPLALGLSLYLRRHSPAVPTPLVSQEWGMVPLLQGYYVDGRNFSSTQWLLLVQLFALLSDRV